jgi:hypothetical protein
MCWLATRFLMLLTLAASLWGCGLLANAPAKRIGPIPPSKADSTYVRQPQDAYHPSTPAVAPGTRSTPRAATQIPTTPRRSSTPNLQPAQPTSPAAYRETDSGSSRSDAPSAGRSETSSHPGLAVIGLGVIVSLVCLIVRLVLGELPFDLSGTNGSTEQFVADMPDIVTQAGGRQVRARTNRMGQILFDDQG